MNYDTMLDGNLRTEPSLCIIKRSGKRVPFEKEKIIRAIQGANSDEGIKSLHVPDEKIEEIADACEKNARSAGRDLSVEEIQDMVENALMDGGYHAIVRHYMTYRFIHEDKRKMTDIDKRIASVIDSENEEVKQENSNKNPTILSVQRDYMAGEWSRHYVQKYILPEDIAEAHNEGIIHFHDSDFAAQRMSNCCLVNLEDMLQNGTAISGTHIDPPKSFATACTVASQIVAQVASSQYGGQTITLSHLAPFVDVSRKKLKKRFSEELNGKLSDSDIDQLVEKELHKEVESGCQTIQYQLITLQSTNG